jgi:ABC-type cobalamin/Fe3+-siderophores transport system ATPase subunit
VVNANWYAIARALAAASCSSGWATASLDFGNQGLVLRCTYAGNGGLAVLLTTHDPNQALRCADRALLMREGRVAAQALCAVVTASALRGFTGAEFWKWRPVTTVYLSPGLW